MRGGETCPVTVENREFSWYWPVVGVPQGGFAEPQYVQYALVTGTCFKD